MTREPTSASGPIRTWSSASPDPEAGASAPERDGPVLVVGTRKGAWLVAGDANRANWSIAGPMFLGHIIQHAAIDPRDGKTLVMAAHTGHLGPTVYHSIDLGRTWYEASSPPAFASDDRLGRTLTAPFWLSPGNTDQPGTWFIGGSPQGLFRSDDGGDAWSTVDGWNDHESWEAWCEWPEQNTPDGSMLHSVIVDPRDADHMYLGLSSGGVFESTDAGADWHPLNKGVLASFNPDPYPEFGHDPHCVRIHPAKPDRLYQQNHCGIYRIDRPSDTWIRIGEKMPSDVGDIGFPIQLHPTDPDKAWVIPMDGTDVWPRTSPDGRPSVYMTCDAGESWTRLDTGLPKRAWQTVKRQAMTGDDSDPLGLYFGTTSGELWGSSDEGANWSLIVGGLPEIFSVEFADPAERD